MSAFSTDANALQPAKASFPFLPQKHPMLSIVRMHGGQIRGMRKVSDRSLISRNRFLNNLSHYSTKFRSLH